MESKDKQDKNLIESICKVKVSLGLTKKVGEQWKKAEISYEANTKDVNIEELEHYLKERANTKLNECFVERVKQPRRKKVTDIRFDPNVIQWQNRTGPKGLFQIAEPNNAEFPLLYEMVLQHGTFVHDGYLYWLLTDGKNVARKRVA